MKFIKLLLIIFSFAYLISNSVVLYITWLAAFFKGGAVTISINSYNEMWVEFVVLPVGLCISICFLCVIFKTFMNKEFIKDRQGGKKNDV
jgi:hypothetical protein